MRVITASNTIGIFVFSYRVKTVWKAANTMFFRRGYFERAFILFERNYTYIYIYIVTIRKLSLGYFLLKDRYKKKKKKYLSIRINLVWTLLIPSLFTRVFQLSIKRFNDAWIFNLLLPAVCYGNQADVRFGATGRRHIGLHLRLVFTKFLIKRWSIEREWNFVRSPLF